MKKFEELILEENENNFLTGLAKVINSTRDVKGYTVETEFMSVEEADQMSKNINMTVFAGYTIQFRGKDRADIRICKKYYLYCRFYE